MLCTVFYFLFDRYIVCQYELVRPGNSLAADAHVTIVGRRNLKYTLRNLRFYF
jgi:hypothetical protein